MSPKQKRVLAMIEASILIGAILLISYQTLAPKPLVLKPEASKVISKPSQSSSSQAVPNDKDPQTIGGSSTATPKKLQVFYDLEKELADSPVPDVQNSVKVVNQNEPVIYYNAWDVPHIKYGQLDQLNRATTATAYLTRGNLGKSKGREPQTFKPTGWHNQPTVVDGKRVFPQNRGHLIAYTLSFNFDAKGDTQTGAAGSLDNPYNLVTQTAYSNQEPMQIYEQKVRDALAQDKKVIYQVTPIFKDSELMARGLWLQAESVDQSFKFSVFIANVQPGVTFDYQTGRLIK